MGNDEKDMPASQCAAPLEQAGAADPRRTRVAECERRKPEVDDSFRRGPPADARCCYTASVRPGRTKTTSFSLDDATLKNLKALAARRHKGNVSALLAQIASREAKFAAAEAFFGKYGVPPLDDNAMERIEAEWRGEPPTP
jgi:hypothetical protein